jgi:hypothetical protein
MTFAICHRPTKDQRHYTPAANRPIVPRTAAVVNFRELPDTGECMASLYGRPQFRKYRPKGSPAFTQVTACLLAESPTRPFFTEGFSDFVTSIAAPITTG